MARKEGKGAIPPGLFGNSEAMKLLRETSGISEGKISLEKRLSKMHSQISHGAMPVPVPGHSKHAAIIGSGSTMSEVNLIPNKILMLSPSA
jgi:hypothetical protein